MKIKPGKIVILIPLLVILISNSFILGLIPFKLLRISEIIEICIGLIVLDLFWMLIGLRPYKSFYLNDDLLTIRYSFFRFWGSVLSLSPKNIDQIRIVKYTYQGKIPPVMFVSYFNMGKVKAKKIFFRVGDKTKAFQALIDTLRAKEVKIECEGDTWY